MAWRCDLRSVCLAVFSLVAGCSSLDLFQVEVPIEEQVVRGSPLAGALGGFLQIPLTVDLEAETEARGTGPANAVRLAALELHVTPTEEPEGDTDTFDFIDSVEVFVESRESGSSIPRVMVAEIQQVPEGTRTLAFDTIESVNLKPYIEEGARLSSTSEGSAPPDDVSFAGEARLRVELL